MPIKKIANVVDLRDLRPNLNSSVSANISTDSPTTLPTREIVDVSTVSTSNLTLSGNQTINGHTTIDNDVILVNGQTDKTENGIYTTFSTAWERVDNNLNDIKLVKVIDGDFNTTIFTLLNEPVEIDVDDIEYVKIYEEGQTNILTTTFDFTETTIQNSVSTLQVIIPAISGFDIQVLDVNISFTSSSLTLSNPAYLTYTNGANYTYTIADTFWTGTGTVRAELKKYSGASTNAYSSGDDWGLYSPSLIYTSGTITGKFYVTYRYVEQ